MRLKAFGTSAVALIAHLARIRLRFGQKPWNPSDLAVESDNAKTPRGVSPFTAWLVPLGDYITRLSVPFHEIAQRLRSADLSHLHFVEPSELESPHTSGWESKRTSGYLAAIWSRVTLTNQTLRQLTQPNQRTGERDELLLVGHSGGGTGSTLLPTELERCQDIKITSSGNIHPRPECILTLQDVGEMDEQTHRLEQNSAAALGGTAALMAGGYHFPAPSEKGWGKSVPYSVKTGLALLHNPGDRGFSRQDCMEQVAYGLYLPYENPYTSSAFHRDADDRKNRDHSDSVRCTTYGASFIRERASERRWYYSLSACIEAIASVLRVREDPYVVAKYELSHRQLREDARTPGLAAKCKAIAFENGDPIRDRIQSKPPRALRVKSKFRARTTHFDRLRREIEPLKDRILQASENLAPQVETEVQQLVENLSATRSVGEISAILRSIPQVLQDSSERLTEVTQRTHRDAEIANERAQRIQAEARMHRSLPPSKKVRKFLHHRALPLAYGRTRQQQLIREVDETLYSSAASLQEMVGKAFEPHICSIQEWVHRMQEVRAQLDQARANLLSELEQGGAGICLDDPASFEESYRRLPQIDRAIHTLAHRLSSRIHQGVKERTAPLSAGEIHRFLIECVDQLLPEVESDVGKALAHRPDQEALVRKAIGLAAPFLSVDVTKTTIEELFLVALPGGEISPFAPSIRQEANRLGLPTPKFVDWPHREEIAFLRTWFNVSLRAVKPLQRAEDALSETSLDDQLRSFRTPIYWLLPRVTQTPTVEDVTRRCLMAAISGQLREENGRWVLTPRGGIPETFTELAPETIGEILARYPEAVRITTWFICQTLELGFSWAYGQLLEVARWPVFARGIWPKAVQVLAAEIAFLARKHHQELGGRNHALDALR